MTNEQKANLTAEYLELYRKAVIFLTEEEKKQVWHWDFYTGSQDIGLSCVTYFTTDRCCARELALLPWRFTPEHKHPNLQGSPGREKTLRCRWGTVYLYVEGEKVALEPGQQYTLVPNTLSWLQAGEQGCVISEFSTEALDKYDVYTDPLIMREHMKNL